MFWSPVRIRFSLLGVGRADVDRADFLDVELLHPVDRRRQATGRCPGRIVAVIIAEAGDDAALLRADPVEAGEQHPQQQEDDQAVEPVGPCRPTAGSAPPNRSRLFFRNSSSEVTLPAAAAAGGACAGAGPTDCAGHRRRRRRRPPPPPPHGTALDFRSSSRRCARPTRIILFMRAFIGSALRGKTVAIGRPYAVSAARHE